jgi:hypothetical protein
MWPLSFALPGWAWRGKRPGHIGGTSARDLPGDAENYRDLRRRSGGSTGASADVRGIQAQDPAYRPAHPLDQAFGWRVGLTCGENLCTFAWSRSSGAGRCPATGGGTSAGRSRGIDRISQAWAPRRWPPFQPSICRPVPARRSRPPRAERPSRGRAPRPTEATRDPVPPGRGKDRRRLSAKPRRSCYVFSACYAIVPRP